MLAVHLHGEYKFVVVKKQNRQTFQFVEFPRDHQVCDLSLQTEIFIDWTFDIVEFGFVQ